MNSSRLHVAMLAVLLGSAALVGCKRQAEPAPMPPVATDTTPSLPPAAPMAPSASVANVELGNAVGADLRVTAPMTTFGPRDTIHAAVSTATSDPAASVPGKLTARWTHLDSNQQVHEDSRDLTLAGDGVTSFQINNPTGWPTGRYKVEVLLDGTLVQTREFEVR
jgi:hypothetical protein